MTLHINKPNDDQRSNSKPLSLEEQEKVIAWLNDIVSHFEETDYTSWHVKELQRLIHHYENLQALSDFVGGWEGAHRLVKPVDGDYEDVIDNTEQE